MSTEYWPPPPDVDDRDARIEEVLDLAVDDYALWMIADAPTTDLPATVVQMWAARVRDRLRRDLTAEDLLRAVEILLTAQAYSRAEDLLWTVREADPDDLLDGPWSP